jgi:hypothetical protein
VNARLAFLADVRQVITVRAPRPAIVTLTPVPEVVACRTCDGLGEVVVSQAADGCIHDRRCDDCDEGVVPNPDWEPGLMLCGCGHALLKGDSCQTCNAYYSEMDA